MVSNQKVDFQSRPKQADLLAEPLSDAEVRTLLERLGSREFGGSEEATLGAVVEATGAEPALVGRLLAEIRKGEIEQKFGSQLQDHTERIETLEERTRIAEVGSYVYATPLDRHQKIALDRLAEEERQKESRSSYGYVWVLLIAIIAITAMIVGGAKLDSPKADTAFPESGIVYSVSTEDGEVFLDAENNVWVGLTNGGKREATAAERTRVFSAKVSSERAK